MNSLDTNTLEQAALSPAIEQVKSQSRWKDYLELTKPRLSTMAIISVIVGFVCGDSNIIQWSFLAVVIGSALSAGGAAAINQWIEKDIDAKMERTQDRPLPSKRLKAHEAFYFGLFLSIAGCLILGLGANWASAGVSALCILTYVCVYTPLKTKSPLATEVGAFPGALPPLIGWVGATQSFNGWGMYLFLVLLTWQMPHFMAIAWSYQKDYFKGGIQLTSHTDPTGKKTAFKAVFWSALLFLLPTYGYFTSLLTPTAWVIHTIICSHLLIESLKFMRSDKKKQSSKKLFFASIAFLPIYLLLITIQQTVFS